MTAFIATAIVTFLVLAFLSGYARHLGNPDASDWATIVVVSILAGLVGSALWTGFIEATAIVSGILS